ncbi:MAG: putative Glycosyl transferase, family 9 [Nitrospira sp.]|nr:putative Glycosyl transferase, family 9 [Nitrospira sp.]MDF2458684.1 putative Glycosyl transferase, family 9 [Nitrospira sp.]
MKNQADKYIGKRGILVIHPGAVGDVLLARPVLDVLRRQFPQHEIVLLAGQAIGLLLHHAGEIDRVFSLESAYLAELLAGSDSLHPAFRKWLLSCDFVVGWLHDREEAIANTLHTLGIRASSLKSPFSSEFVFEHQAARYLEALEVRNINLGDISHPLTLPPLLREYGRQVLQRSNWTERQRLVVIHPGSGSPIKCIESSLLARAIEWMCGEGMSPILLEGPSDREQVAHLLEAVNKFVPVLRDLDLCTVAAVLSHADLYLGNDSGMTHLAAALSIPTIACFGPTNPRRWAPLGKIVSVLTGAPCTCPTWNSVESCQNKVCLHISSERILESARSMLLGRSSDFHHLGATRSSSS